MPSTRAIVRSISIAPATYIQVAGGLNLAALKKFSVAGSVNLPTMCGIKNSPQIRRRMLTPLLRSKLCQNPDMNALPFSRTNYYLDHSSESAATPTLCLPLSGGEKNCCPCGILRQNASGPHSPSSPENWKD